MFVRFTSIIFRTPRGWLSLIFITECFTQVNEAQNMLMRERTERVKGWKLMILLKPEGAMRGIWEWLFKHNRKIECQFSTTCGLKLMFKDVWKFILIICLMYIWGETFVKFDQITFLFIVSYSIFIYFCSMTSKSSF